MFRYSLFALGFTDDVMPCPVYLLHSKAFIITLIKRYKSLTLTEADAVKMTYTICDKAVKVDHLKIE